MFNSDIAFTAGGIIFLIFLVVVYAVDPFKWKPVKPTLNKERNPGPLKECQMLEEYIKGHKKVVFAGLTLNTVSVENYPLLERLAREGETNFEFFLVDPSLGKQNPIFSTAADNRGDGTTAEEIFTEAVKSVDRLKRIKAEAKNSKEVDIRVIRYAIGHSMVLVDPLKPEGKIQITLHSFNHTKGERLCFHLFPEDGSAYSNATSVYQDLLRNSISID